MRRSTSLPVLPYAVLLYPGRPALGYKTYEERFRGRTVASLTYFQVSLPSLDARQYAVSDNLLGAMGLTLRTYEGWQTKDLRARYGLKKRKSKRCRSFESHAVDAWVLAASATGASEPTCRRLWYVVTIRLHRPQLHRQQCAPGGVRHPYGGTRALGFKRGTLVRHPRYGLVSVGGCDRRKGTLSLHAYRTNARLTQKAKGTTLVTLTWTPYRTYPVSHAQPKTGLKPLKRSAPPTAKAGGFPRLKVSSL